MFSLTDPDPYDDKMTCPLIISLAQKVKERKTERAIGFRIYKVLILLCSEDSSLSISGTCWSVPDRC